MLKNVGANWVLTLLGVLSAYVLLPLMITGLGQEGYGVWILISSVTGYLSLLLLGTPMASVRFIADSSSQQDSQRLRQVIATFGGLYLGLGIGAIIVGAAALPFLPDLFKIPPAMGHDARIAFGVVVVSIGLGFLQQLPYTVMAAHHDFVVRNLILAASLVLRLTLIVVFLRRLPSLTTVAIIQLSLVLMELAVSWRVLHVRYPALRLELRHFHRPLVRDILSFSIYVLVLNVGVQLAFQTDSLVIGAFLTVRDIAPYAIANSLTVYFMDFIISIAAVVMPMATRLHAQRDLSALRDMYLKWSKISLSVTLMGGVFILILGPRFVAWWVGPEFEEPSGGVLRILMCSYLFFLPVRGVALPVLMGLGKPRYPTMAFVVAAVLNLVLSLILVRPFGLAGVAWGTAIPNVVFAIWLLVLGCREVGVSIVEYLRYVVARPLAGAVPVAVLLWGCLHLGDVRSFTGLVISGVASVLLFGALSLGFVYRRDPRVNLLAGF